VHEVWIKVKAFFKNLVFLPLHFVFLYSAIILLLVLIPVQVNCPLCGDLLAGEYDSTLDHLKILEVEGELIDYHIEHGWCANLYVTADYEVKITASNDTDQAISKTVLIEGIMPLEILLTYASAVGKVSQLIQLEVPANQTESIKVPLNLWAVGLSLSRHLISKADFSVITDPALIISSCPVCNGKRSTLFYDALKVSAR